MRILYYSVANLAASALCLVAHAGAEPSAAPGETAQWFSASPRSTCGPFTDSWTLSTDDTRISFGVTASGEMAVTELSCPAVEHNWIANPVAFDFWSQATVAGESKSLQWRFLDAAVDDTDGRKLTLRFACEEPALEIVSQWHARPGPGPVHHGMRITNRAPQSVTIGEQPTFDLDLVGATALWSFHSDGLTPDPVGIYRHPIATDPQGHRYTMETIPDGGFIPYVVLDADQQHGVYMGLEWSFCRVEAVKLFGGTPPSLCVRDGDPRGQPRGGAPTASPALRVRGGNVADLQAELAPGESLEIRPGFLGAYAGDLDDAGNRLRRWLFQHGVPDVVRNDPSYPKVQWNAFGATGKEPGSWDPVEAKFYPLIDDIAPLGFEEVMIDVGWWHGDEPDFDPADWPSGMGKAADYAHEKGMRFGLYWTDPLDMTTPAGRRQRADRIRRLLQEHGADSWRSDCTRGAVIGASFAATRGFYEMVDALAEEIPGFQWENCSGGGRIKDYGAMKRAVKIFNSDTYSALHVRQAFHDSSYAFHPAQLEGHLGSVDGKYRPRGASGVRFAFRSMSMGAPEWFLDAPNGGNGSEPWTQQEKEALKACVDTYKTEIRPLIRNADLYHVFPRPDGRNWDGIEYYDPAEREGVVFLFQPSIENELERIRFKGLDPERMYRVTFEDDSNPSSVRSGAGLMGEGLAAQLEGEEMSELIFFEVVR
jgi:glycosyl hydrolase family 36/melibiase-like protein